MNRAKMNFIIDKYCGEFDQNWPQEDYKWKEIKRFQENFSVACAPECFADMLRKSFDFSSNLITSKHYYPAADLLHLAKRSTPDDHRLQQAFDLLLRGDDALISRIKQYQDAIKTLKAEAGFTSKTDGYDLRFISTLLFYAHPETYTIYKNREIKRFAEAYETGIKIKSGKPECILQSIKLTDLVIEYLNEEKSTNLSVKQILRKYDEKMSNPEYHRDTELRVLAQNIIWYATAYQVETPVSDIQTADVVFEHGALKMSGYSPTVRQDAAKKSVDYLKKAKENAVVGTSGENFVLDFENKRLEKGKQKKEAYWASVNDGDGLGYDILSYDENGKEKYIEVKTTNGPQNTPFYVTAVELAAAEKFGSQYYLYRVYKEKGERKIAYYCGDEIMQLCNCPVLYIVTK